MRQGAKDEEVEEGTEREHECKREEWRESRRERIKASWVSIS